MSRVSKTTRLKDIGNHLLNEVNSLGTRQVPVASGEVTSTSKESKKAPTTNKKESK